MKYQKPTLIILETSDIGARYTGQAAIELGFRPLFVCQLSNYQADTLSQIQEFDFLDMPTGNSEELFVKISKLQSVGEVESIAGVITFLDSRLEVAVELSKRLGVRGLSQEFAKLKDKGYAWQIAPQIMPDSILIDRQNINLIEIENFVKTHSQVVLKPRKTAGAVGTKIYRSGVTTQTILNDLYSCEIPSFLSPDLWILQTYSPGKLFSIEGFIQNDKLNILGLTGRTKIGNTESIATFPDDSKVDDQVLIWSYQACEQLLKAANVFDGYFHIEFITGPNGNFIIDANIGRMGGGGIGELLASAYDLSAVDIFKHVIQVGLRLNPPNIYLNRNKNQFASVCYGASEGGFLRKIENISSLRGFHTQILDCEKEIPAMGSNNWSWIGIATGKEIEIIDDLKKLRLEINNMEYPICF